jgi:hypothetical protein
MLFVPDSVMEARQKLLADVDSGKLESEQAFRQALELDPDDYVALAALGHIRQKAGDLAEAEELYRRAMRAQPCSFLPYIDLSFVTATQEALASGFAELAIRKFLLDAKAGTELANEHSPVFLLAKKAKGPKGLNPRQKLEWLADQFSQTRDTEPVAVTAELHSLRLIHQLQEREDLDTELVDALVQEGESIVPLLIGVLRGWAQDVLDEDDTHIVENTAALLGEIGDASAVPALLELAGMEDPNVSGPAGWALSRIIDENLDRVSKLFWELAPELDGQGKMTIAQKILQHPKIPPSAEMLARLFENLDRLEEEDREPVFQTLMSAAIMVLGRPGIDFARSMLRRHGDLLSRNFRRECDEMIEEFAGISIPPRPPAEPSSWTVYDICAGEVDWESEEEESEEFPDDDEFIPEPIRRQARPGRNDPCWCGSGRKYKKCHLDSDEAAEDEIPEPPHSDQAQPEGEFDAVRRRVGQFMTDATPKREMNAAIAEMFGDAQMDEMGPLTLLDWMIHDRVFKAFGRPLIEEYLRRNGSSLTGRERAFLESSAESYIDLYEVQDVKEGTGVEVKSLTSGETMFVRDVSTSKVAVRCDGLFARVVDAEDGAGLSGPAVRVPRMHLQTIRDRMEEDRRAAGLPWPKYLKRNWPRIRARNDEIADEWLDTLRLSNGDGEELVESKAYYQIVDRDALLTALRAAPKIHENDGVFVWVTAEEKGTVLGDFRIEGERLVLECNSRERLARGKNMIAQLACAAVTFEQDAFVTQAEMKRNIRENPAPPKSRQSEISAADKRRIEREFVEDYYAKWPDTKIPALGGKTPRQAVKNAAGKRKVAEILKEIENGEARKRKSGEYGYDVGRLRAELGIKG